MQVKLGSSSPKSLGGLQIYIFPNPATTFLYGYTPKSAQRCVEPSRWKSCEGKYGCLKSLMMKDLDCQRIPRQNKKKYTLPETNSSPLKLGLLPLLNLRGPSIFSGGATGCLGFDYKSNIFEKYLKNDRPYLLFL